MLTDDLTDTVCVSSWLKKCCPGIYAALKGCDGRYFKLVQVEGTSDYWMRDFMPIQVAEDRLVRYRYRPDYLLKKKKDTVYITDQEKVCRLLGPEWADKIEMGIADVVMDGGNVVKCSDKIVMTEKVLVENPHIPRTILAYRLEEAFGCPVVFLPWDRVEKYGHADGIVHYAGKDRVVLTDYSAFSRDLYNCFLKILEKHFDVAVLKLDFSNRPYVNSWAYVNFLQTSRVILVPQIGRSTDVQAVERIRESFPEYGDRVIGVDAREAVRKGGALNCVTWNIKWRDWCRK